MAGAGVPRDLLRWLLGLDLAYPVKNVRRCVPPPPPPRPRAPRAANDHHTRVEGEGVRRARARAADARGGADRDFSNGFLIAEALSRYHSADVQMHSFDSGSSEKRKRDNWKLLAKFFKKKRIPLQPAEVDAIVACKEDAAIKVLRRVHDFVHGAAGRAEKAGPSRRPEGGPGPDSARPRAAKPTRREQPVHARRQAPRAEPRRAAHHRDEGGSDAEDGGGS